MKSENTNDFSKCKIGDKLWSIQLGDCSVVAIQDTSFPIRVEDSNENVFAYSRFGLYSHTDMHQSLFFSNPNIIAPPEPPRLPDYKYGQWVAVWDNDSRGPSIRQYKEFEDGRIRVYANYKLRNTEYGWDNHCPIEELPEVLAKMGEQK